MGATEPSGGRAAPAARSSAPKDEFEPAGASRGEDFDDDIPF
jgi:hypothetical protein